MEPETLTTARLLLRTVRVEDAREVHAACQDPGIQRWTMIPSPYLTDHAESFLAQQVPDGWRNGTMFTFGAFLREDDAPGGHTALAAMVGVTQRVMNTAEIGFWATREHRGRGYVTEAALAVARWAFTRAGIERLEWRAEVGNAASRAVAEKAGFTLEGVLRSATIHQGTRRDCWVGALLPSDLGLPTANAYLPAPDDR
ncbi:acetyltransferase [Streptomyces sulfonofaciens]|uniref:Acetyltransferase n=1 Tax=Streptomyces sulfonofaciens TaxID=68272 RepID=A0A919KXH4_9ACTN|nr:GNAT family protein [Streptomyces sulfonofaciens]GHH76228.1 acetyltransferase [Streptomyces sulfonofaciens]